jgi:hypothetical protein
MKEITYKPWSSSVPYEYCCFSPGIFVSFAATIWSKRFLGIITPKKSQNVLLKLKGIVQPFELGGETRLIRSYVKK